MKEPPMPPFQYSNGTKSENAGFIVFLDKKIVIVYSNDLAGTPTETILDGCSEEAQMLVRGFLCNIQHWVGGESLHRSSFEVPAIFAAYNLFMNAVIRLDQIRSSMMTMKKEPRTCMSIWTAILDWSCNNAYALYKTMSLGGLSYRDFKRDIVKKLCPERDNLEASESSTIVEFERQESKLAKAFREAVGVNEGPHVLVKLKNRKRKGRTGEDEEDSNEDENLDERRPSSVECRLCGICREEDDKKRYKCSYGCPGCQSAYHPECYYSLVHHAHAMEANSEVFKKICLQLAKTNKRNLRRAHSVPSLESGVYNITIPAMKKSTILAAKK